VPAATDVDHGDKSGAVEVGGNIVFGSTKEKMGGGFLILWGLFAIGWAVGAVVTGAIGDGRRGVSGSRGPPMTPVSHPAGFWVVVAVAGLIGVVVMVVGVRQLRK
jgi:hypothetical protein